MTTTGEIMMLEQNILEFYNTSCETRRKLLQSSLDQFQENPEAWRLAINLIDPTKPINVQFFGAKVLYLNINKHFDLIVENSDNVIALKNFYIQVLTLGADSLPHSVLNKLSSGLAILVLKSLPDIWPHPFQDLILLWSNQLELLLRVFAEIGSEFYRLNVSLNQRNGVKTELRNTEISVVQIAQHVLEDAESSASLRNAAIECIELWLKLPNAKLEDYMCVFNAIFSNVGNDFPALARILCTIKSNEEFENLPKLIWQIAQFIACNVCPRVEEEFNALASRGRDELLEAMDELVPLISVLVEFGHDFAKQIVRQVCSHFADDSVTGVFLCLCQFFFRISNLPGIFPIDENISDLPEPWWCSLREELLQPDVGSTQSEVKRRVKDETTRWYLDMLQSAIGKLTRNPQIVQHMDKEAQERFESYRTARSDVSVNAIQLAPKETIVLLAESLDAALDAYDPDRSEAILHLFKEAADFISQSHLPLFLPVLQKCGPIDNWLCRVSLDRLDRYTRSLLEFFKAIEHHLFATQEARAVISQLMNTILSCLQLSSSGGDLLALETLVVALKSRETLKFRGDLIEAIITRCYDYFSQERYPQKSRLLAMRCVGIGLSYKPREYVLSSLNQILAPRLAELDRLATNVLSEKQEQRVLFELGLLAQLVATLDANQYGSQSVQHFESPVRLVVDQLFPIFNKLLANNPKPSAGLITKLCDILKASIQSLYTHIAPLLDTILTFIDTVIDVHPQPICELAKSLFLTFHKERAEVPLLVEHLAKWYTELWGSIEWKRTPTTDSEEERDEQMLGLAYQVMRKFWNNLVWATTEPESAKNVARFIHCQCLIISKLLHNSRNMSLIQEALRFLSFLLKQNSVVDNQVLSGAIEGVAEQLITVVFNCIQSELITSHTNLIADILHNLNARYPAQTRSTIYKLPGGDCQLVAAMFANHSVKNFRLRCTQMHQALMLQRVPPNE